MVSPDDQELIKVDQSRFINFPQRENEKCNMASVVDKQFAVNWILATAALLPTDDGRSLEIKLVF